MQKNQMIREDYDTRCDFDAVNLKIRAIKVYEILCNKKLTEFSVYAPTSSVSQTAIDWKNKMQAT
jgi:hypothetical protein